MREAFWALASRGVDGLVSSTGTSLTQHGLQDAFEDGNTELGVLTRRRSMLGTTTPSGQVWGGTGHNRAAEYVLRCQPSKFHGRFSRRSSSRIRGVGVQVKN